MLDNSYFCVYNPYQLLSRGRSMATNMVIDILAREALQLMKEKSISQKSAISTTLRAHKDVPWKDGLRRELGIRISQMRAKRITPQTGRLFTRKFRTFAESSLPRED